MKIPLHAGRQRREKDIHALIEKVKFLPLDKQYEAYIRSWRPPERNQRDYYWHCLRTLELELADHIEVGGWEAEDWHKWFKTECGIETTKDLDVQGWTDYISRVQRIASSTWGYALDDPE